MSAEKDVKIAKFRQYVSEEFPEWIQDGVVNRDLIEATLEPEKVLWNNEFEDQFYGLLWPEKKQARAMANQNSNQFRLKPNLEKSINWNRFKVQNLFINGQNLDVLQILSNQYFEQVDVIYIDPPYNTGNDLIYHDNFHESDRKLYHLSNFQPNLATSAYFHTKWLNMIYPRLLVAKKLLKQSGMIMISIDDRECANLKIVCDEIFGEKNFVAKMVWQKKNSGGGADKTTIEIATEYILVYAKNSNKLTLNGKPIDPGKYHLKDQYYSTRGAYKLTELDRGCSRSSFKYQASLDYEIEAPDGTWFKNYRNLKNPQSHCYTLGKDLFAFSKANGFIEFKKTTKGDWKVYRKIYQNVTIDRKNKTIIARPHGGSFANLIIDSSMTSGAGKKHLTSLLEGDKTFSFPKPVELIKYLINLHQNKNALVLDFFAGSATTIEAVYQLNQADGGKRQTILVQLPELIENHPKYQTISDLALDRIKQFSKDDQNFNLNVYDLDYNPVFDLDHELYELSHDYQLAIAIQTHGMNFNNDFEKLENAAFSYYWSKQSRLMVVLDQFKIDDPVKLLEPLYLCFQDHYQDQPFTFMFHRYRDWGSYFKDVIDQFNMYQRTKAIKILDYKNQ